jgi:hypothetical protein
MMRATSQASTVREPWPMSTVLLSALSVPSASRRISSFVVAGLLPMCLMITHRPRPTTFSGAEGGGSGWP